jgi:hypothetical protein
VIEVKDRLLTLSLKRLHDFTEENQQKQNVVANLAKVITNSPHWENNFKAFDILIGQPSIHNPSIHDHDQLITDLYVYAFTKYQKLPSGVTKILTGAEWAKPEYNVLKWQAVETCQNNFHSELINQLAVSCVNEFQTDKNLAFEHANLLWAKVNKKIKHDVDQYEKVLKKIIELYFAEIDPVARKKYITEFLTIDELRSQSNQFIESQIASFSQTNYEFEFQQVIDNYKNFYKIYFNETQLENIRIAMLEEYNKKDCDVWIEKFDQIDQITFWGKKDKQIIKNEIIKRFNKSLDECLIKLIQAAQNDTYSNFCDKQTILQRIADRLNDIQDQTRILIFQLLRDKEIWTNQIWVDEATQVIRGLLRDGNPNVKAEAKILLDHRRINLSNRTRQKSTRS